MAKYCFYCGKELNPGERCTCRQSRQSAYDPNFHPQAGTADPSAQTASSTESAQAAGSAKQAGHSSSGNAKPSSDKDPTSAKDKPRLSLWARFTQFRARRHNERQARKAQRAQTSREQFTQGQKKSGFSFRPILNFLTILFTRPTEVIRQARQASRLRLIIVSLIEAGVFSLLMWIFVRYGSLTRIAMFREEDLAIQSLQQKALIGMFRGFFASLFITAARVFLSYIVFRFVGRERTHLLDLWKAYLPGSYYSIFIMLIAIFFVAGTGLHALIMMLCAFALRTVIDTLSVQSYISLPTDRLLFQTSIIYFLVFVIMAMLINLSVPSLANFGMVPHPESSKFRPNA